MEETIYVQHFWAQNPHSQTIIYTYNEQYAYNFKKYDRSVIRKAMNHVIFTWWHPKHEVIAKPQVTPIGT